MRNISLCLIFSVCFLLSPLVVFSAEEQMIESTENASMELSGQVVSVDIENQQVVVEYQLEDSEDVTTTVFYLSEATEIYKDGEKVSTSGLKEGDKVVVTYQIDDNGSKVISRLTLNN
ncbi:MAG: hypothetical protein ABII88_02050 [Candidatus Omnitrophota bacterium]